MDWRGRKQSSMGLFSNTEKSCQLGKNSNYGVPYCIHFYLVLIWYTVKWHSPQIIICRKQSFSNPIPMDINVQCLLPWAQSRYGVVLMWSLYCARRWWHSWLQAEQGACRDWVSPCYPGWSNFFPSWSAPSLPGWAQCPQLFLRPPATGPPPLPEAVWERK